MICVAGILLIHSDNITIVFIAMHGTINEYNSLHELYLIKKQTKFSDCDTF